MSAQPAEVAFTLPAVLALLRRQAAEDANPEDASAAEVMRALDIAWIAAERWRVEQSGDVGDGDDTMREGEIIA